MLILHEPRGFLVPGSQSTSPSPPCGAGPVIPALIQRAARSIRGAHTAHEAPGNPSPITNNPITTRSFSSGRVCFQPAADEPRGKLFAFTFSLLQDFPPGSAAQLCSTGCCSGCTGTQHIFFLAVQEILQICGIVGLKPAARLVCTDLAMPHERCGWRQPLAQQTHSQRLGI